MSFKAFIKSIWNNNNNEKNNNNNKKLTPTNIDQNNNNIKNINNNNLNNNNRCVDKQLMDSNNINNSNNMINDDDDNSSSTTTNCDDNNNTINNSQIPPIIKLNGTNHNFINEDIDDNNNIIWPTWCKEYEYRSDLKPISRNGLDEPIQRFAAGFKGENYVYQNRKFTSKLYWKGKSPLIIEDNQEDQLIESINDSNCNINGSGDNGIVNKDDDRMLMGVIFWKNNSEGPPGCVHGGALASMFDDSMACCIRYFYNNNFDDLNQQLIQVQQEQQQGDGSLPVKAVSTTTKTYVVTANLSVNYKKFVVLESFSMIETRVQKRDGKKIYISSTIKDQSGVTRAEATAVWIVVKIDTSNASPPPFLSPIPSPTLSSSNSNNSSNGNSNGNFNNNDNSLLHPPIQ